MKQMVLYSTIILGFVLISHGNSAEKASCIRVPDEVLSLHAFDQDFEFSIYKSCYQTERLCQFVRPKKHLSNALRTTLIKHFGLADQLRYPQDHVIGVIPYIKGVINAQTKLEEVIVHGGLIYSVDEGRLYADCFKFNGEAYIFTNEDRVQIRAVIAQDIYVGSTFVRGNSVDEVAAVVMCNYSRIPKINWLAKPLTHDLLGSKFD